MIELYEITRDIELFKKNFNWENSQLFPMLHMGYLTIVRVDYDHTNSNIIVKGE
jgi:hypothetical protein